LIEESQAYQNEKDIIYLDEYRHHESIILGESPSVEFSIIILFAYLSYNLGEVLSLSGIVSVFSCGICMSHYVWYNLTWIAQISLHHIIFALSKCCENFVYVYLGISTILSLAPSTTKYGWNILLIIFTISLCILSRAANIFPLSLLANTKRKIKISVNMQIMIFFSGLRGAIAFALALNINTPNSDLIITTTLTVVILTTILCGCTTKHMLDTLGLNNNNQQKKQRLNINDIASNESETFSFSKTNNDPPPNIDADGKYHKLNTNKNVINSSESIDIEMVESPTMTFTFHRQITRRISSMINTRYGFYKYWHRFDTNYMQNWFGGPTNPYVQHSNIGIYSNRRQTTNNYATNTR